MSERLLREWIRFNLSERAGNSWAPIGRKIMADIANISGLGIDASNVQKGGYDKQRKSIRLIVPGMQSGPTIQQDLQQAGAQIVTGLTAAGYTDRAGKPAKIRSSVSGRYPSISLTDPSGINFFIVLNPGFRLGAAGGNAGPGETELEEIVDEPVFQQWAPKGGMTFNFDNISIPGVTDVSKPADKKGMGGEPKSDIDLVTTAGTIRLSLKGPTYPTYDGISEPRLKHYPGFLEIAKCAKELLAIKLLSDPSIIKTQSEPGVFEVKRDKEYHYDLPLPQQLQAIYGTAATGGPVDYVITADGVVEYMIADPAQPIVDWEGFKVSAKNPDSSHPGSFKAIPENGTPVLAFRTAADRGFEVELQGSQGVVIVSIPATRPTILPGEQRKTKATAGPANRCPSQSDIDDAIAAAAGDNLEEIKLVKHFVHRILLEELTKSDKKEIDKLIKKGIEKDRVAQKKTRQKDLETELKKSLGKSFFRQPGMIRKTIEDVCREELAKEMKKGSGLEKSVVDVTKKVLAAWHELIYKQKHIIQRVKI